MSNFITLGEYIIKNQQDFPYAKGELTRLFNAITLASKVMNSQINKAGLVDDLMGKVGIENVQGEEQKKLDVYANKIFINSFFCFRLHRPNGLNQVEYAIRNTV